MTSPLATPLKIVPPLVDLNQIRGLAEEELQHVTQLITNDYCSKVPLINQITDYIIECGGKHLRPLI